MNFRNNRNILVIGDIMVDHYIIGTVERISPEAPVPIVNVSKEEWTLGGCGNTIQNLHALGCTPSCVSVIGNDPNGEFIERKLIYLKVNFQLQKRSKFKTITKTRIVDEKSRSQLLRYDKEEIIDYDIQDELSIILKEFTPDIIVVSDYGKGVINEGTMNLLRKTRVPIIVDPKPKNTSLYRGVYLITPNRKEYEQMTPGIFNLSTLIIETRGREGIFIRDPNGTILEHVEAKPVEVYNVAGAGDTVVAVLAICVSMGLTISKSVFIANLCGQYVVTQPGTSTVPKEMFDDFLEEFVNEEN